MDIWLEVSRTPAFWGLAGAFVYAGPRFSACAFVAQATGGLWFRCAYEAVVALMVGAIAGEALAPICAEALRAQVHTNAVAAMLGLIANPTAPKLIDSLSGLVANVLNGKIMQIFKGEPK